MGAIYWNSPGREIERHSADGRTFIQKAAEHAWVVWFEDERYRVFPTREKARVAIRHLKKFGRPSRWDLIGDPTFLAHLPDPT
jgi:hypothetical protein